MPKTNRMLLIAAVIAVAGVGQLAFWRPRSSPNALALLTGESSSPARAEDPLPPLTDVAVPVEPYSLAWSADGRYLAAGTWGRGGPGLPGERPTQSDVYVVDVAKASSRPPSRRPTSSRASPSRRTGNGWPWAAASARPSPIARRLPS